MRTSSLCGRRPFIGLVILEDVADWGWGEGKLNGSREAMLKFGCRRAPREMVLGTMEKSGAIGRENEGGLTLIPSSGGSSGGGLIEVRE